MAPAQLVIGCVALLGMGLAWSGPAAYAQDLQRTHLKVVGTASGTTPSKFMERPFWEKTVPQDSAGAVTADYTPIDLMGMDDAQVLQLLKIGVMDLAAMDVTKFGGDDPRFEGCDLAGASLSFDEVRRACNAYRDVFDRLLREKWNVKFLAFQVSSPQAFWCTGAISGLNDLKGKKVRLYNQSQFDWLNGLGGSPIRVNYAEVVPALQRGVVDCAITSPLGGNNSGWGEVTTHLYPLSLGWGIGISAINLQTWERLDPQIQEFLAAEFEKYEDEAWRLAEVSYEDAQNCNLGKDPCEFGKKVEMQIVPLSESDAAESKRLVEEVVLPAWAERCGTECAEEWNETVGSVLGFSLRSAE